jgi:predicted protein tyrosine phosphatase
MAWVLSQEPYNFNTRAAGLSKEFALIPVDQVLLTWADEIVCASPDQAEKIREMMEEDRPIVVLNIEDNYRYRDPNLVEAIKAAYPDPNELSS